jgi:hypothetical protein
MGASMSASSSWWKTFQQQIHSLLKAVCLMFSTTPKSMKKVLFGRRHLFGAEMLESLQASSKKQFLRG